MDDRSSRSGIGFFGLLGIVFVVLKLTGVIDWSWWWVTAPLWGGLALVLTAVVVTLVYFFYREYRNERKRRANNP